MNTCCRQCRLYRDAHCAEQTSLLTCLGTARPPACCSTPRSALRNLRWKVSSNAALLLPEFDQPLPSHSPCPYADEEANRIADIEEQSRAAKKLEEQQQLLLAVQQPPVSASRGASAHHDKPRSAAVDKAHSTTALEKSALEKPQSAPQPEPPQIVISDASFADTANQPLSDDPIVPHPRIMVCFSEVHAPGPRIHA